MGQAIEYVKQMIEVVYINLPGPQEPKPSMTGGELLHGFLAELHNAQDPAVRSYIESLCAKWNVHFRQSR